MSISPEGKVVAGRFRLTRKLAQGGSAEVFAAIDQSTNQGVALKRLLDHRGRHGAVARFMREYYALSELRHPRIIEVYDYGVDNGEPYYTMELLDGHDLNELSPLPYREACRYLRDVASSLALLHARRLLHRDVSPRNVRRTNDGRCKLIDFGAMIPFGTPANVTGTPPCIPPEALQGGALDQRSDLYALGALAYFVLTGRHAYPSTELRTLPEAWRQGILGPARRVSDIPEALDELVLSLLDLDPMNRPSSAAEVIDLLSAIGGLPAADDNIAVGRSFLVSSQLIGRSRETSQLQLRLSKAAEGQGCAILVSGAPGSGKTRLLSAAALIAQTCGLLVVRTALRKQRGVSSSFIQDLIGGLRQVAPEEAEPESLRWPLVRAAMSGGPGGSLPDDRAALLHQVETFVREVASTRPLLITVDDLQHADELASGLVAGLAHRASDSRLAIVASHDGLGQGSALTLARGLATVMQLEPLDRGQTIMLAASLFGDAPNLERVGDWFFQIARGNPKMTLELAEALLARGTLRYVDGSWLLPEEITEPLPVDTANALIRRLSTLGSDARALAELLAVRRGGASAEQLLALAQPKPPEVVFRALEELVRERVLESAGDEYAFVQEALRSELGHSLAPSRRQELHERWAKHLLSQPTLDQSAQLEAGWHLVHTRDELRGAELLAKVAPDLVERRVSMATAIPALERALEVYDRHDQSLAVRMRIRSLLVLSSYLFDYHLAERYAEQTLDALYPFTGLAEAERCARVLGKRLGFVFGVGWAALRWLFRPRESRGPRVIHALRYYAYCTMGYLGLRALAVDTRGVRRILERMRGFDQAPHPTLAAVYLSAEAIHLHNEGRGAEVHHAITRALARLEGARPWRMSAHEQTDLTIGLLLLQGIDEANRVRSRALECADKLDRFGTPLAAAAALRVRMTHHLLRGDTERAHHYRRLLDLKAIENGSHWQVEWLAVPLEGLAAATWTDLLGLRRSVDRLERLVLQDPAFEAMRDTIRLLYLFRRGDYAETAVLGEEFMLRYPPLTRIAWAMAYAMVALAYVELGRPERAREICEHALKYVGEGDSEYFAMYTPLDAAYAAALALTGEPARSRELFKKRISMLSADKGNNCLGIVHEYRIKVARLLDDRIGLQEALDELNAAAIGAQNASFIALAHRLSQARSVRPHARDSQSTAESSSLSPDHDSELPAMGADTSSHTLSVFLSQAETPRSRAQQALAVLGHYTGSSEGYLYLERESSLQLSAALDEHVLPSELLLRLQHMAAANDTQSCTPLESNYCAYRLAGGFAVLRSASGRIARLPETLLADIGRSLRDVG